MTGLLPPYFVELLLWDIEASGKDRKLVPVFPIIPEEILQIFYPYFVG
jgi:hypothetical protein